MRRGGLHAALSICVDSWRVRLRRATQAFLTRAPCAPPAAHELNPLGGAYAVAGLVQEAAWQ